MEKNKVRQSNLELLRIVCMGLIILAHCIQHGNGNNWKMLHSAFSTNHVFATILGNWGYLGVSGFILISCYFISEQKINYKTKKLVQLILQVMFYCLILAIIGVLINGFSWNFILKEVLTPFYSQYWFITSYLVFYLISPYLNVLTKNLQLESLKKIVIVLTIVIPYYLILWEDVFGNISYFIYYYFIISYLKRKENNFFERNRYQIFFIGMIMITLCSLGITLLGTYLNSTTILNQTTKINTTNNIILTMISISMFYIFKKMKIPYIKFINKLGKTTFGIYILHENLLFTENISLLWDKIFKVNQLWLSPYFPIYILQAMLIVFIIGAIIETIRSKIIDDFLLKKCTILDQICKKIDNWYIGELKSKEKTTISF